MKNNKTKNVKIFPLLNKFAEVKFNVPIDVLFDKLYISVSLPSRVVITKENGEIEEKIIDKIWVWDGEKLVEFTEFIKDKRIENYIVMPIERKMSFELLDSGINKFFKTFFGKAEAELLEKIEKACRESSHVELKNELLRNNISTNSTNSTGGGEHNNNNKKLDFELYTSTNSTVFPHEKELLQCIIEHCSIINDETLQEQLTNFRLGYELLFLLKKKIEEYMDFEKEEDYYFISLWAIGTYFFYLFDAYPYLFVHGVKRSGKTTLLKVLERVCFNSIFAGNVTASSVFRIVDALTPTLLIDETDALASKRAKPELREILLNGYKKGSFVLRSQKGNVGKKEEFLVEKYRVYCPKALVNIEGLEDVLEDRTIYFHMSRTMKKEKSERSHLISKDKDFEKIRDMCYVFLFKNWKNILELYEKSENETKLKNREWELWKPILVLAKYICGKELYEKMVKYAEEKARIKQMEEAETRETLVLMALLKLVKSPNYYPLKEIKEKIKELSELELDERSIGRTLKALGFTEKRGVAGKMQYFFTPEKVKETAEKYGVEETEDEPEEPKEQPTNEIIAKLKEIVETEGTRVFKEIVEQKLTKEEIETAIKNGWLADMNLCYVIALGGDGNG